MLLLILLLHHISFSCSFYSFSKYCYYPSITHKNECQSVMKRSFVLRLRWRSASVEAEETYKRYREHHRIRLSASFEEQVRLLWVSLRPQEMEGTEAKPRENNKGRYRLIAFKLSKIFGCLGSFKTFIGHLGTYRC